MGTLSLENVGRWPFSFGDRFSRFKMAWATLKEMANHYGKEVRLRVVDFPLPYHRAAFKVAIGLQVIGNMKKNVRAQSVDPFDYMDLMFNQQDAIHSFANSANDSQLVDYLSKMVSENLKIDKATFENGMSDPNMDWLARVDWKFGCSIGVSGTPFPYINRVFLDAPIAEFKLDDWKKILDPMINDGQLYTGHL